MKDERLYLRHIVDCIHQIHRFVQAGETEFFRSELVHTAVLRSLHVMTESCKRLSLDTKSKHPEIDWNAITGLRNRVVHDYFDVDLSIVWQTINEDLPPLLKAANDLMAESDLNEIS